MYPNYLQKPLPFSTKTDIFKKKPIEVNKTLQPVSREDSNLEAEEGERAVVSDGSGLPTQFGIAGNRHSSGGTPLNLPANSFIFSRDRSMKITDPQILQMFGMAAKKSGYTPADIAKKYDINDFRKTLADKNSDRIQRDSAESMIRNYNEKLAQLALVQESKKGFPTGIPLIAMPYLHTSGLNPAELMQQQQSDEGDAENTSEESTRYGGNIIPEMYRGNSHQFGGEPKFNYFKKGGEFKAPNSNKGMVEIQYAKPLTKEGYNMDEDNDNDADQGGGETLRRVRVVAPGKMKMGGQPKYKTAGETKDVTPYKGRKGEKTPTGQSPSAIFDENWYKEHYKKAGIDVAKADDKAAQEVLYDKADPFRKAFMWGSYGDTAAGGTKSKYTQFAPKSDEAFSDYKKRLLEQYGSADKLNEELGKYKSNFADGKTGIRNAYLLDTHVNPTPDAETIAPTPEKTKETSAAKDLKSPGVQGSNEQVPADFWLQDIIKTAGAAGDQYRIKKYLPWQANYTPHLPQATFYDPTRELAQNSENANISAQALGMFGSPQQLAANLSSVQGQAAGQAANILGKYNSMNVSASNQNEQQRTAALNEVGQYNATNATNLYDKNVMANQNFDNAKAMARQQLRGSFIDAITNRGQTQSLNNMYPQYRVDPLSGGTTKFTGKDREIKPETAAEDALLKKAHEYASQSPGTSAIDWYKILSGK